MLRYSNIYMSMEPGVITKTLMAETSAWVRMGTIFPFASTFPTLTNRTNNMAQKKDVVFALG